MKPLSSFLIYFYFIYKEKDKFRQKHTNYFKNAKKIPAGFIEVHLDVERGGIIEKAKIFGDFFASEPIEGLENKLIGVKHNEEEITKVLNSIDVTDYFGKVTVDEILELFR